MKRVVSFALVLLVNLLSLHAGEGILVPREVYVGDTAEFSFESGLFSSVLEDGTLFAVPPEDLPSSAELDVKSILVARQGPLASITIRFVPWVSGVIKLPSFKLKGISVAPPVVRIGSLLEKTGKTTIEPARSPLLVPGTTWLLYGAIFAILLAIVVVAFAAVKLGSYFLESPGRRQAGRRAAILLRDLKQLERKAGKIPVPVWYASFALSLRKYFGAYCDRDFGSFLSLTGTEIAFRIRDFDVPLSVRVASLFTAIDEIRFGGAGDASSAGCADGAGSIEAEASTSASFSSRELSDLTGARDLAALLEDAAAVALEIARQTRETSRESSRENAKREDDAHARIH